mmetsp:Transcript_26087/g.73058  ORF Transcript_26087/g.73058 Transcript_26087/m.73058 type:complete len:202 (-) Transcript_26087:900-1505(-)
MRGEWVLEADPIVFRAGILGRGASTTRAGSSSDGVVDVPGSFPCSGPSWRRGSPCGSLAAPDGSRLRQPGTPANNTSPQRPPPRSLPPGGGGGRRWPPRWCSSSSSRQGLHSFPVAATSWLMQAAMSLSRRSPQGRWMDGSWRSSPRTSRRRRLRFKFFQWTLRSCSQQAPLRLLTEASRATTAAVVSASSPLWRPPRCSA